MAEQKNQAAKDENTRLAEEVKQSEQEAELDEVGGPAGESFYNEALTGSGTINRDGTYGPPQPDPTEVRGLGPQKTSGGRTVVGGGLGDADTVSTGPTTSEDPKTRSQASANKR